MQATGAALRAQLGEAQAGLAAAGGAFLRVLEMMQEAARVQAAIRDSRQARLRARPAAPRAQGLCGRAGAARRGAAGLGSLPAACTGWRMGGGPARWRGVRDRAATRAEAPRRRAGRGGGGAAAADDGGCRALPAGGQAVQGLPPAAAGQRGAAGPDARRRRRRRAVRARPPMQAAPTPPVATPLGLLCSPPARYSRGVPCRCKASESAGRGIGQVCGATSAAADGLQAAISHG